jgi:hypothetical protein
MYVVSVCVRCSCRHRRCGRGWCRRFAAACARYRAAAAAVTVVRQLSVHVEYEEATCLPGLLVATFVSRWTTTSWPWQPPTRVCPAPGAVTAGRLPVQRWRRHRVVAVSGAPRAVRCGSSASHSRCVGAWCCAVATATAATVRPAMPLPSRRRSLVRCRGRRARLPTRWASTTARVVHRRRRDP